jgi:hypothetical protein
LSPTASLLLNPISESPDLEVLSDPVSWKLIKENAGPSGVAPLIAYVARPHVTGEERAWCDKVLTHSWASYERSLRHLNWAVGVLEAEDIRALSLKGPLLARRYYDPPFLRKPSVDLDLAVRDEDLERACAAFVREGYVPHAPLRQVKALSYHAMLLHPTRRRIELHFRLNSGPAGIAVSELFERATPCELPGGRAAWVLSPPDELLYLVLHMVGDRFAALFHTYEVRRIWLENTAETRRKAVQLGIEHHCMSALKMADVACRSLWGEALFPVDSLLVKTWLDQRLNEDLYRAFADWWKGDQPLRLSNRLRGRWLDFQLTDRPLDAFRMAQNLARTAWFSFRTRGWRTAKIPRFATARSKRCA